MMKRNGTEGRAGTHSRAGSGLNGGVTKCKKVREQPSGLGTHDRTKGPPQSGAAGACPPGCCEPGQPGRGGSEVAKCVTREDVYSDSGGVRLECPKP